MLLEELRQELVFYGKQMLKSGLTLHTGGNISARDKKRGLIAIKPSGFAYDSISPQDVPVIDLEGKKIEGKPDPSSEWPLHTLIYRQKPRVMAIVHTHSPYATACSVAGLEIPLLYHELAIYSSEPIHTAPFEIPGSLQLGVEALKYLQNSNIVLLQSHGPLALGASLWHAFDAACAVEQAARIFFITLSAGKTPSLIPTQGLLILRNYDPLIHPESEVSFRKA